LHNHCAKLKSRININGDGSGSEEAVPELQYNPRKVKFLGYIPFDWPEHTRSQGSQLTVWY